MFSYVIRRLLLIIPTLVGIMVLNFLIIQTAPGGPVEQIVAQLSGVDAAATDRIGGTQQGDAGSGPKNLSEFNSDSNSSKYRGARGLDPDLLILEIVFSETNRLCHLLLINFLYQ